MTDETTQTDAEVIAEMFALMDEYERAGLPGQYYGTGIGFKIGPKYQVAARRTIETLTAERDAIAKVYFYALEEIAIASQLAEIIFDLPHDEDNPAVLTPDAVEVAKRIIAERDAARAETARLRPALAGMTTLKELTDMYEKDCRAALDAARAELARLRERLTKLADENEAIERNHQSVGQSEDDICASTWGQAGRELRAALGEDGTP